MTSVAVLQNGSPVLIVEQFDAMPGQARVSFLVVLLHRL
jgi:hypothetical protein